MKKFTKVIALILSLTLLLCFPIGVSAAEPEDTGVDTAAKGSLTIYKVDMTNAEKDGAWDSSYVSTGVYDQNVNDTLNSYTLKDVEFTYLRVADVVQLTGSAADGADSDHVETLYGISKTAGADLLNALGLGNGANRYEKADGSALLTIVLFQLSKTLDDRHQCQAAGPSCGEQRQDVKGRHGTQLIAEKYCPVGQLTTVFICHREQLTGQILDHQTGYEILGCIFFRKDQKDGTCQ